MSDEHRDDALVILECNTEKLAGLSDGPGIQAIANLRNLRTKFQYQVNFWYLLWFEGQVTKYLQVHPVNFMLFAKKVL